MNERNQKSMQTQRPMKADVLIIGDSMTKQIRPSKLSRSKNIICRTLNGAKIEDAHNDVCKFANEYEVSEVVVHLGTNNLQCDESDVIIAKTISLLEQVHTIPGVKTIATSTIIHRLNETNQEYTKVSEVNAAIKLAANQRSWLVIDNDNIDPGLHLNADGVHLNRTGTITFAQNIIHFLRRSSRPTSMDSQYKSLQSYDVDFPPLNDNRIPQNGGDDGLTSTQFSYPTWTPQQDAQKNEPPAFPWHSYSKSRRKPENRVFPKDWMDSLTTARNLLNNRYQ